MSSVDQTSQTVTSDDIIYTSDVDMSCWICGDYGCGTAWPYGRVCRQHLAEYVRGDTDWWELVRLVAEAVDDS